MRAALSAVGATSRGGHRTVLRKAISWLPRVGEPPKPVKFCFLDKDVRGGTMCRCACPRGDAWPGSAPFLLRGTPPTALISTTNIDAQPAISIASSSGREAGPSGRGRDQV